MKKHVLLMIMVLMSLNVVAQEMEEFDRMSAFPVTNVVSGTKKKCMYINGMEPYSSMDMMGIKSGDLLVAYDDTIATIYRAGGIKLRLKDIQCVQVEKGRYLTELEVMDWGKTKYGHVAHMTWDGNPFIYSKTQVYSDPEVSLYDYATFDFEFTENNIIQQKEIAGIIEKKLIGKNLKRDKENPDILILLIISRINVKTIHRRHRKL